MIEGMGTLIRRLIKSLRHSPLWPKARLYRYVDDGSIATVVCSDCDEAITVGPTGWLDGLYTEESAPYYVMEEEGKPPRLVSDAFPTRATITCPNCYQVIWEGRPGFRDGATAMQWIELAYIVDHHAVTGRLCPSVQWVQGRKIIIFPDVES